jgi:hypothetical protein
MEVTIVQESQLAAVWQCQCTRLTSTDIGLHGLFVHAVVSTVSDLLFVDN